MRTLKRTSGLLALMLLVTTLISAQPNMGSNNQKGDKKGRQGNMQQGECQRQDRMFVYLELTAEQQTKIDALKLDHQKKVLPLKNELNEKNARMNTLQTAEIADMKAINSLIDEMGAIKTKMTKEKATHHQEIRKILTEEQRIKFDMHQGNRGGHGKGNGCDRN
jgi:Spy/CpxP family protein refolding chaperone